MTPRHSIMLGAAASSLAGTTPADVKIGSVGNLSSDTGLSTLRGVGIAVGEINIAGGMSDKELVFVSADTGEGVIEDVRAYEYPAETEEVDFIISGSTDDVSLG